MDEPKRQYSREDVCRLLDLTESVLRQWEQRGLIPILKLYEFSDLIALKTLQGLRKSRFSAKKIRSFLDSVRDRLSHLRSPLHEIKIITDGSRIVILADGQKMEPFSGQMLLDFDKQEINRLLQFPVKKDEGNHGARQATRKREAEKWFAQGVELEQTGAPPEKIVDAYKKALEFDAGMAYAMVNLGTIYYQQEKWAEAEKLYVKALELTPDYALGHFNLASLYDERGKWEGALQHYLCALEAQPDYADAHYNLALLYQTHGEVLKAVKHWRLYLKLDASGYWAGIARRELRKLKEARILDGAASR